MKVNGRTVVPVYDWEREKQSGSGPVVTYHLTPGELAEVWRKYGPPNTEKREKIRKMLEVYKERGFNEDQIILLEVKWR